MKEARPVDEVLDEIALDLPLVKAWVAAAENMMQQRLEAGVKFMNVRLAPTRPMRAWTDDGVALERLKKFLSIDECAPRVVLSPAQAQKKLGDTRYGQVAELVQKKSSGLKLVFGPDSTLTKD